MGNKSLIFAGQECGGTDGTGLAWFAAEGTTLPTTTSASLAAFTDAGLISEDGVEFKPDRSVKEIKAAGSSQVQRVLVTEEKTEFSLKFLETNETTAAVFAGKTLASVSADVNGALSVTYGGSAQVRYTAVFDIIDGTNHVRVCCPSLEMSGREGRKLGAAGEVDTRGVTFTAYPDSTGVAVYEYILMTALAA